MNIFTRTTKTGKTLTCDLKELGIEFALDGKTIPQKSLAGIDTASDLEVRKDKASEQVKALLKEHGAVAIWNMQVMLYGDEPAKIAAAVASAQSERAEIIAKNVPGIEVLQNITDRIEKHSREFSAMMEDEDNDGVNPPTPAPSEKDLKAAKEQYPVAALYLKAKDYTLASNFRKSGAGDKAAKLLEKTGQEAMIEAENILENWWK